jgi:hypothetical protein
MQADDGLEYRADGETPAPKLAGNERGRLLAAEDDPNNGQVLEHLAGVQIGDVLAEANGMTTRAPAIPAPRTLQARSGDHGWQIEARPDSCSVGRQAEGE